VKAELEIELLHEKIDELRAQEVLRLTGAVRCLAALLQQPVAGAGNVRSGTRPGDMGGGSGRRTGTTKPYSARLSKLCPEAIFISGKMEFRRTTTLRCLHRPCSWSATDGRCLRPAPMRETESIRLVRTNRPLSENERAVLVKARLLACATAVSVSFSGLQMHSCSPNRGEN
jgi:hypothetical protein